MQSMQIASQIENSARSATLTSMEINQQLFFGKSSLIDSIFPLFDHMAQKTHLPNAVLSTICIYMLFQFAMVPLWFFSPPYSEMDETYAKIYSWILKVFLFMDPTDLTMDPTPYIILDICVLLLSIIWFISMIIFYKKVHTYHILLLYASTLILDLIDPLFIMPTCALTSVGIMRAFNNPDTLAVLSIVVGFIAFVGYQSVFTVSLMLKSRSVVLTNLMFPLFDSTPIIIYTCGNAFFLILSAIVTYFQDWFFIVAQVLYFVITLYIIYVHIFIPFYDIWRNYVSTSIAIMTDVLTLVSIIANLANFEYALVGIIGLAGLFVSLIITGIIFNKYVKKIKKELTAGENNKDCMMKLADKHIESDEKVACMYVIVGFSQLAEKFVDGSLTDYLIENTNSNRVLSILTQATTFFPSESRKMNVLFKKIATKKNIGIADRFLLYQSYKIKTRRLASDTKDTFDTFTELKNLRRQCQTNIASFWNKSECDVTFLSSIAKEILDIDRRFQEAISNNPNNPRITTEYSTFLIECKCSYDDAILQHVKAERIRDGKNFNVDVSFRSLVAKFPRYLKDRILDVKGRRILSKSHASSSNNNIEGSTQQSSSGSRVTSGSVISSLDLEAEEAVSKRIIRNSKLRLAFHTAVRDKKPPAALTLIYAGVFGFIVAVGMYLAIFFYAESQMNDRLSAILDLSYLNNLRFYTDVAIFSIYTNWGREAGYMTNEEEANSKINHVTSSLIPSIDEDLPWEQQVIASIQQARDSMQDVLNRLVEMSTAGKDVYALSGSILEGSLTMQVCKSGNPFARIKTSLKDQFAYMLMVGCKLAATIRQENIYQSEEYCEILSNSFELAANCLDTITSFQDNQVNEGNSFHTNLTYFLYIGVPLFVVVSLFPFTIIGIHYIITTKQAIKILLGLPQAVKDDAKIPIRCDQEENEEGEMQRVQVSCTFWIAVSCFYICLAVVTIIYILFVNTIISVNDIILNCNGWYYYSSLRAGSSAESGNDALQLIFITGDLQQNITSRDQLLSIAQSDLDKTFEYHNSLIRGGSYAPAAFGFDDELDRLTMQDSCANRPEPTNIHDSYKCASLNQQVTIFKNFLQDIINQPESYGGKVSTEVTWNIYHIMPYHFWPSVQVANERIIEITQEQHDSMKFNAVIYMIVGIVVSLFEVIFATIVRSELIENYEVLMIFFQHISPANIVSSKEILNYFLNQSKSGERESMSTAKSIVYNSSEAIIITSQTLVVESLNQSVTSSLGFTPDQMLGQQITNFMSEEQATKMNQDIQSTIENKSSAAIDDHINLISDNSEQIPFHVTVIPMKGDSDDIQSFVFILNNETEIIKKQKEAEEAKAKSEKLLYQILPKDIVFRLNRGEKDISFTIPHATIFFIDVVKFSEYSASLTPSEIMSNLSCLFDSFDKNVAQYPSITKIKLIGDVYMAAAGLFADEDTPPQTHAADSINCCFACLKSLEEINVKLSSSLEVRIGVNTGGPLIGGVLGTEKPTFDIIGDPINIASRLQSTDVPGKVQISQGTKEVVEGLDFVLEERGEVFLKGKGKQMTYFVSPGNATQSVSSLPFVMSLTSIPTLTPGTQKSEKPAAGQPQNGQANPAPNPTPN